MKITRWRAVSVASVLAIALAGWLVWHYAGDEPSPRTKTGQSADGKLRFEMPLDWVTSPCPFARPACVGAGRPGSAWEDQITMVIMVNDPNAREGNPGLLLFDESLSGSSSGIKRFTLDGHRAVRTSAPADMAMVLLNDKYDVLAVSCSTGKAAVCDLILETLKITWP